MGYATSEPPTVLIPGRLASKSVPPGKTDFITGFNSSNKMLFSMLPTIFGLTYSSHIFLKYYTFFLN